MISYLLKMNHINTSIWMLGQDGGWTDPSRCTVAPCHFFFHRVNACRESQRYSLGLEISLGYWLMLLIQDTSSSSNIWFSLTSPLCQEPQIRNGFNFFSSQQGDKFSSSDFSVRVWLWPSLLSQQSLGQRVIFLITVGCFSLAGYHFVALQIVSQYHSHSSSASFC